jgi:uncharacterized membrane protein (UPF0136 family)
MNDKKDFNCPWDNVLAYVRIVIFGGLLNVLCHDSDVSMCGGNILGSQFVELGALVPYSFN